jgi:hypothetical protein
MLFTPVKIFEDKKRFGLAFAHMKTLTIKQGIIS